MLPFFSSTSSNIILDSGVLLIYTDKKKITFSSYIRKILMRFVAKSFTRKRFLIYEEMRKYLTICEEGVGHP